MRGDGVHVAYDNSAGGDNAWADRVTITLLDVRGAGHADGVSVTGGRRVTATRNTIDQVGMYSFDVEPDGLSYGVQTGAATLDFSYNTVGSNGIDGEYSGYVLGVGGSGADQRPAVRGQPDVRWSHGDGLELDGTARSA